MKLELVLIPVTDVDRAKAFYTERLGFALDVDHAPNDEFRVVQMTPPGSACSITVGIGFPTAEPGVYRGTHLVVEDIEAVRDELVGRGVEVASGRELAGATAAAPSGGSHGGAREGVVRPCGVRGTAGVSEVRRTATGARNHAEPSGVVRASEREDVDRPPRAIHVLIREER